MKQQLKVDPIKNGTVIDHITAGKALQVIDLLNMNHPTNEVMIGMNLLSKKMGKKDIIKIEDRQLSDSEVNSIALLTPTATVIYIDDYKVVRKLLVQIPDIIDGLVVCPNPKCVTNVEKVKTRFEVAKKDPIQVRCVYCERKYDVDAVKLTI